MIRKKVSKQFPYFSQAAGLVFDASPRFSVLNWIHPPHTDRGVVNPEFLSMYRSDGVLLMCRASQDPVLRRSGHVFGV